MPRTAEQNKAIKEKRAAQILDISLKKLALIGYNELTIDDIAKEAGCSHGLFYHYYKNSEEVYAAVMKERVEPLRSKLTPVEEALAAKGSEGLKILAGYYAGLATCKKDIAYAEIIVSDNADQSKLPEELVKISKFYDRKELLLTLIKEGQAEGKVIEGDPEEITRLADTLISGLIAENIFGIVRHVSPEVLLAFLLK